MKLVEIPRLSGGLACLLFAGALAAAPIKQIKVAVTNPTPEGRRSEHISLAIATLKRIAPDFDPTNFVVTATDAATLAQDAATMQAVEVPAHVSGANLDFQIALLPNQTRIVSIAFGSAADLAPLRFPPPRSIEEHGMLIGAADAAHRNSYGTIVP